MRSVGGGAGGADRGAHGTGRPRATVIGLVGPIRAGKTTIAEYLEGKHGALRFRNSAFLESVLDLLEMDTTRENLVKLGASLFQVFGKTVLARATISRLAASSSQLAVVDGIRFVEEVDLYSENCDFILVYVDAPARTRYERALRAGAAGRKDELELTFEAFLAQERDASEVEVTGLAARAARVVRNTEDLEKLWRDIDEWLGEQALASRPREAG